MSVLLLVITILIKFLLLLVVRHLFLIANIVTTSKALVTSSILNVGSSILLLLQSQSPTSQDLSVWEATAFGSAISDAQNHARANNNVTKSKHVLCLLNTRIQDMNHEFRHHFHQQ